MNDKVGKVLYYVANFVQLGSIIGLAGLGLKRNNDCYKAECKLLDTEVKLACAEISNILKDHEIEKLKKQLEGKVEEES